MLTFLSYTILFWISGATIARYFFLAIQPEQVLDKIFNWQKMLEILYGKDGWYRLLGKGLGDCEMCFASSAAVVWFAAYCVAMNGFAHIWIPTSSIWGAIAINAIWYLMYVSIQWNINLLFITGKLFGGK